MSLPPPGLPPEVGARSRLKAVSAELAEQQLPKLQAALLFELGALTELRLGDPKQAYEHYANAILRDPSFRPALFASARVLRESHDDESLVRILAKTVQAETADNKDRASALVELGCLLEDRLADPAGAQNAFERALSADPQCLSASAMREATLLGQKHRAGASLLIARRSSNTLDPKLRSVLACEAARDLAADGDIDAAVETLLAALAMPGRQLPTLMTLAELASRYGRPWVAARANEDMAALLAGFASGHTGPEPLEIATRFADQATAAQAAAFYCRSAARLRADSPDHIQDALLAHERAAACMPGDVLLGLELAAAYQSVDAISDARTILSKLLPTADADPRCAAALQFELAELAERQTDSTAALAHLRAAQAAAPEAPAITAVLEDRLLDAGALRELCDLLCARANKQTGAERKVSLYRAALTADRAQDSTRALSLLEQLIPQVPAAEQAAVLRELHGIAQRAGLTAQLRAAGQRLLACDIAASERSALWRSCYEAALSEQDMASARASLKLILGEPACEAWAAHAAWLLGGLHGDQALVARAHAQLAAAAQRGDDRELAAAHLVAEARAHLRSNADAQAVPSLRRALELSPGHPYAVTLLERSLLARGETAEAITLLRESALADHDAHSQQAALLQAGHLAEAAGELALARSSYEEAAQRDPAAFAPQWARLRFAERSHDAEHRLSSLRALAERETAQERPGSAHLELGDALAARGEFEHAAKPLSAAIDSEASAFEAAASAVLLPRGAAAEALRPRALSELAEQTARQTRRALEHERLAELIHQCPADALLLLGPPAQSAGERERDALLRWLVYRDPEARADTLASLVGLSATPQTRAELLLHAERCRRFAGNGDDGDALVHALGLLEDAPEALATAVALREALDAGDDPETRVAALHAWLATTPPATAHDVKSALARALLDAGDAQAAQYLLNELLAEAPNDPSHWEALRVAARLSGDFERVVVACDELAKHAHGDARSLLLEEAAAILHERLERLDEAEERLRAVLERSPERKSAFERLHDVLVDQEDLDDLLELLAQRIGRTSTPEEKTDLLYERARILRARGDKTAALASAEELLSGTPAHAGALGLCAEIYASNEAWSSAVDVLRRLSETELTPAQKRLAIEGAADFLEDKLGDHDGAYRELQKLLGLELADLGVHLRMAQLAHDTGAIEASASAWTRAAALSRGVQRASHERRAAALYLTLEQNTQACDALRRALLAHPQDEAAFALLYVNLFDPAERDRLAQEFVDGLWTALASDPSEPELLRALVRAGRMTKRPVLAQLGLFALEALAHATPEERTEAAALRAALPERPRGRLSDEGFGLLAPAELTPELLRFGQACCAALLTLRPDSPEQRGFTRRMRIAPRVGHPQRDALLAWLQPFGLELADLYVSQIDRRALYPIASTGPVQTWVVGSELTPPFGTREGRRLAPLMAAARAQLSPLAGQDAQAARANLSLPLMAIGVLDPSSRRDPNVAREASLLVSKVTRALRDNLQAAIARVPERPRSARDRDPAEQVRREDVPVLDVEDAVNKLAHAAVTLGRRAAIVGCGELAAAAPDASDAAKPVFKAMLASPSGRELLRFWLSPQCARLLQEVGMSA